MKSLLEEILHEFNTLHGLWATDGFGAYGDAQRDGYGTNAAWDAFKDGCFRLDVSGLIKEIESTLSEPLLVDELAEGCKLAFAKLDSILTDQASCPIPLATVVARLGDLLARHQEGVVDV